MITLFKPGSKTISMLQFAKEQGGEMFSKALQDIALQKAKVQNLMHAGVSKEAILEQTLRENAALVKFVNDNELNYQLLFETSDLLIAVAMAEES